MRTLLTDRCARHPTVRGLVCAVRARGTWLSGLAAAAILLALSVPASAIILYGNTAAPTSTPPSDTLLRWNPGSSGDASAVAISSDCILTVRHTNAGVGTYVVSGTNTYVVAEIYNHGAADLRVARLTNLDGTPAVLPDPTAIYTGTADTTSSPTFVMGGYGDGRGTATGTGYLWADNSTRAIRWGANHVTGYTPNFNLAPYVSDVLTASFSSLASQSSIITEGDSGGGWFIQSGSTWYLAGIIAYAGANGYAQFSPPEAFAAVRVSSYQGFINGILNPITWMATGSSGNWSASGNWSPTGAPNAADKWAVFGSAITSNLAVTLDQNVVVGDLRFDATGNVTLSGPDHTLTLAATNGTVGIEVNRTSSGYNGAHTIVANITLANDLGVNQGSAGDFTISGAISGAHSLTKTGIGNLILSGLNLYTGGTLINQGTLTLTSTGSLGSGAVTVAGGTLSATGTLLNNVTIQAAGSLAHSAPGSTIQIGKASVASTLTFAAGATYSAQAVGNNQADLLNVYGATSLAGANLAMTFGYSPAMNDQYTLVKASGSGAISGTFANKAEAARFIATNPTTLKGYLLSITYTGGTGSDVVAKTITIQGDANQDGFVDGEDYGAWQNGYQHANPTFAMGDFNLDGTVDGVDYGIWQNMYNTVLGQSDSVTSLAPAAAATVGSDSSVAALPEPATLTLLAVGGLAILRRRARA